MQFMLLLKGDVPIDAETGSPQVSFDPAKLVDAMHKFNAEMAEAGVLVAAEGLDPGAYGARVVYRNGQRRIIDGPFAEAKELVAGFYLIDVKSQADAIEWASRCPVQFAVDGTDEEAVIEVRRVGSVPDLYPELG